MLGASTLFLRNHNRIAISLSKINPKWDEETLFQEARRINIATYQHNMYSQWLSSVIGKANLLKTWINFMNWTKGTKNTGERTEITGYNQPNFINPSDVWQGYPSQTIANNYDPTVSLQFLI